MNSTSKKRLTDDEKHALVKRYHEAKTREDRQAVLVAFGRPSLNSLNRWVKEGYGGATITAMPAPAQRRHAADDNMLAMLSAAEQEKIISGEQAWKLMGLYTRIAEGRQ